MKYLSNTLTFITSLLIIGGILVLLVVASYYIIEQFQKLESQWSSGILTVSLLMFILMLLIVRFLLSNAINKDKAIHPEKAVIYGNFIEFWSQTNSLRALNGVERTNLMNQRKQLSLWAADKVLKEYLKLEKLASTNAEEYELQEQAGKVIMSMRKDIGNQNLGIVTNDLSGLLEPMKESNNLHNKSGLQV